MTTKILIRPRVSILVGGPAFGSQYLAGFKPAIAANLVRCGLAVYVDHEGKPSPSPVEVAVVHRSDAATTAPVLRSFPGKTSC